jgi:hypothetical protein
MPEVSARWLWAAIGVLIGAGLVAVSAVREATKIRCSICGTKNLALGPNEGEGPRSI